MPIIGNHPIKIPFDQQSTLWKYFSMKYFTKLIEEESLFFCRIEDYWKSDKFEGTYTASTIKALVRVMDQLAKRGDFTQEQGEQHLSEFVGHTNYPIRKRTVAACFSMCEVEQDHMWKNYAAGYGAAIKTNGMMIERTFADETRDILFSRVRYIDHEDPDPYMDESVGNIFSPLLNKNISFEAEKEVRLIYLYSGGPSITDELWEQCGSVRGHKWKISLSKFISEVVLSPRATEEDRLMVESLIRSKGIKCPVRHSVHSHLVG
jgi:hypothetical protein